MTIMTDHTQTATGAVDLSGEAIHWDQDMSYGQYLALDELLAAQKPQSGEHDEMLFIVIHQASELWMKLSIHELGAALDNIRNDNLRPAFKMLSRIARIQEQLLQSWEVLSTMTPFDYLRFRDKLGKSSGFQSYQYRLMEFTIGNKNARMIEAHRAHPEIYARLKATLDAPSLYDETLKLLARRGFDIPPEKINRDWSQPYEASAKVEAAWLKIYRNVSDYWDVYELAEKLVDLEYHFQQWRFTHMKTVERIIGHKQGTGGTSGVSYLNKALDLRFFPELWTVRTAI
jgi:tryptophan 2,3-dioxygenase